MFDDKEFSINESTFELINTIKIKLGFQNKNWDDFFQNYFNSKSTSSDSVETKIANIIPDSFMASSFDMWVKNFALNLNFVWEDQSAKILETKLTKNQTAIVIGRGPSLKKHNHLEILNHSNYDGLIVSTDAALISTLKAGVTPDKFPNFYVVSIDHRKDVDEFYDDDIVCKFGPKIKGIFSPFVDNSVIKLTKKAGIKSHWMHTLFDYGEGKKSFNRIAALMARTKNDSGLPAIQTGGNVGTSAWFVSWQILKCKTIGLIGINHGWDETDSWEKITSHGYAFEPPKIDQSSKNFNKLFPKIYNPDFDSYCILDPVYNYYRTAFIEFISRSPAWLSTINATEGGCIFGDRIKSMKFTDFLSFLKN